MLPNKNAPKSPIKIPEGKTDRELKTEVIAELDNEPKVSATDIGVLVKEGTVTLNGVVESYDEKWSAMESAKRVEGVSEIADDIEVQLPDSSHCGDSDIAAEAGQKLEESRILNTKTLTLMVSKGWITLEGEVEWLHQKKSAEECLRKMAGVRGVSNLITVKEGLSTEDSAANILAAFRSNDILKKQTIEIVVLGSKVILQGHVKKASIKAEAERIAASTTGVFLVENQIKIG